MVVCKFGGSSLSNGDCFLRVKDIVCSNSERKVVVVSAPGKGVSNPFKVTDLLINCCFCEKKGVNYEQLLHKILLVFDGIIKNLRLKLDLVPVMKEIAEAVRSDYELAVSRGEYLSAKIMAELLGYRFVDARDAILFDYAGRLDEEGTRRKLDEALARYEKIVVPGFYGGYPNGAIKLMSRGGSDVSGSIIASLIRAELYENWTDVSGVMRIDPTVHPNPEKIKSISYSSLRVLSYLGAGVLSEDAILPVERAGVPVRIKNTFSPSDEGTLVCGESDCLDAPIGVAVSEGYRMLTVKYAGAKGVERIISDALSVCSASSNIRKISRLKIQTINVSALEDCVRILYKTEDDFVAVRMRALGYSVELSDRLCVVGALLLDSDRLGVAVDACRAFGCLLVWFEDGVLRAVVDKKRRNSLCEKIYKAIFVENN